MKKLLLFLIFPLFFQWAHACDCPESTDLQAAIDSANVVFRGKCLEKTTNWVSSGMKYTFQVEESWVRTIEPFTVINSPGVGNCGYPFEVGKEYLVYVNKKFSLKSTICDPTKPFSEAGEDLTFLGPSLAISGSPGVGNLKIAMIVLSVLGILFMVFVVFSGRIFKKKPADT